MTDEKKTEPNFNIEESEDGSAVVHVPESMAGDFEHEDQSDAQHSEPEDMDSPDDDEELRTAKRNRRKAKKELIRKTNQEKDVRLTLLSRENDDMKRRLAQLEKKDKNDNIQRIDYSLNEVQQRIEYAKHKHAEAIEAQDGQAAVEALALLDESKAEAYRLSQMRNQANSEMQQERQERRLKPEIEREAAAWMKRNPWFNPSMSDPDSKIAKKIDELLTSKGMDPADPEYWDELDRRLQAEIPHAYNQRTDSDTRNVNRPRNVVGSSGREASAAYGGSNRTTFVLTPERVQAMKAAGAWDNPEKKHRMIQSYIRYDQQNRRN